MRLLVATLLPAQCHPRPLPAAASQHAMLPSTTLSKPDKMSEMSAMSEWNEMDSHCVHMSCLELDHVADA